MKQFYALDKATREIAYQSASLFMLKDAIKYDNRDEADFIFTEDIDMKYLSRVVYVDDQCIYNNKDFWTNSAADIIENYDEHTVLDFLGKPVDKVRFEVEYNSNSSRIAAIDGVAGEVDYNIEVANEMIALFKEECILTDFIGITPLEIAEKLAPAYTLVLTGSFREAKTVFQALDTDPFLTEERKQKYIDMLDAADSIEYASGDELIFTTEPTEDPEEPVETPTFTRVYTMDQSSNMTKLHTFYYAPIQMADTDKLLMVIRHAERDDTSGEGDLNETGVNHATSIGTKLAYGATPSSSNPTPINIEANDAHYWSTEIPRTKHTAQAIAAARGDTDSDAADYSGVTVDQDLLEGYRFMKTRPSSGATALLRKYSNDPSQLTEDELSTYFGVSTAEEAVAKRNADTFQFANEMLAKADKRLNVFVTHDYFIGPFIAGITDGQFDSSNTNPWVKYCSGVALVLHEDNTYDAFPIKCDA